MIPAPPMDQRTLHDLADGAGEFEDPSQVAQVTALLVVRRQHAADLDATCQALARQTRRPDRLVIVDTTEQRVMRAYVEAHDTLRGAYPELSVLVTSPQAPFAAAVDTAVDALPPPGEDLVVARRTGGRAGRRPVHPDDRTHWLWLLHEDSAPDADALEKLLAVVTQSERVGVAGCKVLDAADTRLLVDVGTHLTRAGRHVRVHPNGEPDQGQHDERRDVLSVSSSGVLIRQDVYSLLGGFDPAFDGDGDGLDLGWRAHLTGHQVVVVPAARVRARVTEQTLPMRTVRRHRQVALARASLLGMPFLAARTVLGGLLLGAFFLLVKRPGRAGRELAEATAPFGIARILGARARFFRRASTRRRNLRSLFVTGPQAWRAAYDEPAHDQHNPPEPDERGPVDTDTDSELDSPRTGRSAFAGAVFGPGGLAFLVLAAASAVLWRDLLTHPAMTGTGSGLSGGQLLPFDTGSIGVWRSYRDAWVGSGVGHVADPAPYLAALAPLAWLVGLLPWVHPGSAGGVAVAWLLFLAMPLSGLTAYRAGRIATHTRWPRAVAAVLWGCLPTLTTAVSQGRLGPAVGHVLLPFALAGSLIAVRRQTSAALTAATVLVVALTGAFDPTLLLACTVVALAGLLLGAPRVALGGRLRAFAVLLLPWALLGPWTRAVFTDDWRAVLAGPGTLVRAGGGAPAVWETALLHPGGAGSYAVFATVPVVLLGMGGLLRAGLGRAGAALIALGLLGLAAAYAAAHVTLAGSAGGPLAPWPGSALDVCAFALLAAALLGVRGPVPARVRPWLGAGTVLALLGGSALAGFAAWTATPVAVRPASPAAQGLPAVVAHQLDSSRMPRALVLSATASDPAIAYRLVGVEAGLPARDLGSPDATRDASTERTVAALTAGPSAGPQDAHRLLHRSAVGYVVVDGTDAVRRLATPLQRTSGLTQLASGPGRSVWRVEPLSGNGRLVTSSRITLTQNGTPVSEVGSVVQHGRADVDLPAGGPGRAIVLAEGAGWAGRGEVRLDGRLLSAEVVAGRPTYALPVTGGHLSVRPGVVSHRLPWAQLALLLALGFIALPFGSRKEQISPDAPRTRP